MDQYTPGIVLVTMNSAMRKQAPGVSLHSKRWSIRKINFSVSTEDEKEKEASSGGWRVKEGSEFTLGCQGSAQGGAQADLERLLHTEGWASTGAIGRCPRGSGQARRQESRAE